MNADLLILKEFMAAKGLSSSREFDSFTKAFVYYKGYLPLELAMADSGFKAGLQELRSKYPLNPTPVKSYIDDKQRYSSRQAVIKAVEEGLQRLSSEPKAGNQYVLLLNIMDSHGHLFTKKKCFKNRFTKLRATIIEKRKQHNELYRDLRQGRAILDKIKPIVLADRLDELSIEQCNLLEPAFDIAIKKLIENPFLTDVFEQQTFKKMVYAYIYLFMRIMDAKEQCGSEIHNKLAETIKYCAYLLDNDVHNFQLYYWRGLCYALQGQAHEALADFRKVAVAPNKLDKDSHDKATALKKLFEIDQAMLPTVFNLSAKVLPSNKKNPYPLSGIAKQPNTQKECVTPFHR